MNAFELRQWIEEQIPAWVPIALFILSLVIVIFGWDKK